MNKNTKEFSPIYIRSIHNEDQESVKNIYAMYWLGKDFLNRIYSRLDGAINNTAEAIEGNYLYYVAERDGDIIGSMCLRNAPQHMRKYALTKNPAELYIIAVKKQGIGIGKMLVERMTIEAKKHFYTEIVLYSGDTHKESWGFYDHLKFERVTEAVAPNGELGQVWRLILLS